MLKNKSIKIYINVILTKLKFNILLNHYFP